jgi:hypothetical protein
MKGSVAAGAHQWPPLDLTDLGSLLAAAAKAAGNSPPTATARILECLREVRDLASQYIHLESMGAYSIAEYTDARAFIVLSHGVIEEYLERMALEVVDSGLRHFDQDGRPRTALLSLLAHSPSATHVPPDNRSGGRWLVREHLASARQGLWQTVHDNHGITERHLLSLLLPTGIKESDLAPEWLRQMSRLGETRGRVAHGGSGLPGASKPLDPGDATRSVVEALPGLCRLDWRLVRLRDE